MCILMYIYIYIYIYIFVPSVVGIMEEQRSIYTPMRLGSAKFPTIWIHQKPVLRTSWVGPSSPFGMLKEPFRCHLKRLIRIGLGREVGIYFQVEKRQVRHSSLGCVNLFEGLLTWMWCSNSVACIFI